MYLKFGKGAETATAATKRPGRSKYAWAVLAATLLALVVSACSSSGSGGAGSSSTSGPVAAAKSAVSVITKPAVPITLPGGAIDASSLKGKTVTFIPIVYTDPYFHSVESGLANALASVGAKVVPCDANGSPSDATQCLDNAMNSGSAAVVVDSIPTEFAPSAFNALAAKGIPIVFIGEPTATQPQNKYQAEVFGDANSGPQAEGRNAANVIVADSNGTAKVLLVQITLGPEFNEVVASTKSTIEQECPKCEVTVISVTSTIGPAAASAISAGLLAHPGTDYVMGIGGLQPSFVSALQNANENASQVKFVAVTENLSNMQSLAAGRDIFSIVTEDPYFLGWAAADQSIRMVTKSPLVTAYPIPQRTFTQATAKSVTLTQAAMNSPAWYGGGDWEGLFRQSWGVQK